MLNDAAVSPEGGKENTDQNKAAPKSKSSPAAKRKKSDQEDEDTAAKKSKAVKVTKASTAKESKKPEKKSKASAKVMVIHHLTCSKPCDSVINWDLKLIMHA